MGTIQIDGSTPKLTIGNATAEDATILFDGNAQDFYIALDDSADDLLIGLGSTVGSTPIIAIDENKLSTFSGAITVGVDDTGHDVKLFGASAGAYALWDESANLLDLRGATAAGPGHLKLTTGELTVVDADVLGKIEFQAPLETGTDAITVAASIYAEADDTFSASVNNTDLVFALGKSEAAAEKFRFTADTEIGIGGANYGTDGQVLTSGGADAAVAWEDAAGFDVSSITGATALGATPADTDEFVLSDAGVLKRVDYSYLKGGDNTPSFYAYLASDQSLSSDTWTKLLIATESWDTDSAFASNKFTVPEGEDGKYVIGYSCGMNLLDDADRLFAKFYVNGGALSEWMSSDRSPSDNVDLFINFTGVIDLSAGDYVELYGRQNTAGTLNMIADYTRLWGFKLIL